MARRSVPYSYSPYYKLWRLSTSLRTLGIPKASAHVITHALMYSMYRLSDRARILPFTTLQLSVAGNLPLRIESFESYLNACRHGDHGWISDLESRAATSIYKAIST